MFIWLCVWVFLVRIYYKQTCINRKISLWDHAKSSWSCTWADSTGTIFRPFLNVLEANWPYRKTIFGTNELYFLNPMAILFVLVWNGAKITYTTNVSSTLGETNYRKIPIISPGAYIFQRPFFRGLFLEGLLFGGAYLRREFAFQNRLG